MSATARINVSIKFKSSGHQSCFGSVAPVSTAPLRTCQSLKPPMLFDKQQIREKNLLLPLEQAKMLKAAIPNSELAIIRGATHGVIREEADISNFVILSWAIRNFGLTIGVTAPEGTAEKLITSSN